MAFLIDGLSELQEAMQQLADNTSDGGAGYNATVSKVLEAGAQPMHEQMYKNATADPKVITDKLRSSIRIGKIKSRKGGGKAITIGVHRQNGAFYASPVEFGHGGPAPAPAHPFVRPAYDQKAEEAFAAMRDALDSALFGK